MGVRAQEERNKGKMVTAITNIYRGKEIQMNRNKRSIR